MNRATQKAQGQTSSCTSWQGRDWTAMSWWQCSKQGVIFGLAIWLCTLLSCLNLC